MQTRRHFVVAAVAIAIQIVSLAVATDILGADVSGYATGSEKIEATAKDTDERWPEGERWGDDGWTALDRSEADDDQPVAGLDAAPDQLAVEDPSVDPGDVTVDAEPTVRESIETSPSTTGTTATTGTTSTTAAPTSTTATTATTAPIAAVPDSVSDAGPSPTVAAAAGDTIDSAAATIPLQEALIKPAATIAVAKVAPSSTVAEVASTNTSSTTSTTSTSTSTTSTSTTSTTSTSTTTVATTTSTTKADTSSTTWLPVTTRVPITTWRTTTTQPVTTAPVVTSPTVGSGSTTQPPTTIPSTTKPSTTIASTTKPSTTAPTTAPPTTQGSGSSANDGLSAIANTDPRFSRFASTPSASLDLAELTEPAPRKDNGSVGDGQFRAACQYSHFAYDDPIVFPGQSGRSHLHMFFGNTATNANSTTNSIVNTGGGSCNGFELNRSAYWTPALLDGKGNAVVPDMIILYYKSKETGQVQRMPQGLKMVSGNTSAESFNVDNFLYWSCGGSGQSYNKSNRIPNCNGDTINATISFPQCWDGRNMDSADHRSHMALVSPHKPCPSTHPVRLPQISILLYFPGQSSVDGWHLSSDRSGGFNTGPGATLHADWWGGWNDETMDLWTDGCMKAARNCSFGQTGTDRQLAKLNNFQNYQGPNFLPLP